MCGSTASFCTEKFIDSKCRSRSIIVVKATTHRPLLALLEVSYRLPGYSIFEGFVQNKTLLSVNLSPLFLWPKMQKIRTKCESKEGLPSFQKIAIGLPQAFSCATFTEYFPVCVRSPTEAHFSLEPRFKHQPNSMLHNALSSLKTYIHINHTMQN